MSSLPYNSSESPVTNNRTQYIEYTIAEYIWTFVPPLIITIGTVGNVTTIFVYVRPSMWNCAIAVSAITLAISDTVALFSGLLFDWLILAFDINISFTSSFGCKLIPWLVYTSVCYSAWVITSITVERVAIVWFPLWPRRRNDKKFSKTLLLCIFLFCMVLNSHLLYGLEYDREQSIFHRNCSTVNESYEIFFQHVLPWINTNIFCFIPSILILIGNTMIILKLLKAQNENRTYNKRQYTAGNRHGNIMEQKTLLLFPLLLTLNTVFLITTLPINIYLLIMNFSDVLISEEYSRREAKNYLCWTILNMLMFTNNAVNCLLYCLSGSNFRKEVMRICCK